MEQKRIANMQLNHLGIILSNISLVGLVLMVAGFLYFLVYAVIIIIMIIPVLFTFGLYLINNPNYFDWVNGSSDTITKLLAYVPTVGIVSAVAAALSIVCLSMYKGQKSWWRIVFSGIIIVVSILVAVGVLGAI